MGGVGGWGARVWQGVAHLTPSTQTQHAQPAQPPPYCTALYRMLCVPQDDLEAQVARVVDLYSMLYTNGDADRAQELLSRNLREHIKVRARMHVPRAFTLPPVYNCTSLTFGCFLCSLLWYHWFHPSSCL